MICPTPAQLSAYVDGAVTHRERERVAGHLLLCDRCRQTVAELKGVRATVRRVVGPAPPSDLAERLVNIAGDRARAPLTPRPFEITEGSRAPRVVRRVTVGSGLGLLTLLVAVVTVGWAAAPEPRARIVDPAAVALAEFTDAAGTEPLASAALSASFTGPVTASNHVESPEPAAFTEPDGAYEWLDRARDAAGSVPHSGTQLVQVRQAGGFWSSTIGVGVLPGNGTQVTVGQQAFLVPDDDESLGVDAIAAHHELSTGMGPVVAGRRTQVVDARRDDELAARWWIDAETGLLLWTETFAGGLPVRSLGFQSLQVGDPVAATAPEPLSLPQSETDLAPAAVAQLSTSGYACSARVSEFDLVRVRRSDDLVHSVYGDGVDTVSVIEQSGALNDAPDGTVWDPSLRAYRSQGLPTMISWQSGDRVITVVTDAAPARAAAMVAALPHDPPILRTPTTRVTDGLRAVLTQIGVR